MTWLSRPLVVTSLAVIHMAGAMAAHAQPANPPAHVEVATAEHRALAPQALVPGTVIARNDARLSAEVAARVTWIAEVGATVAEGEPVARLDDRTLALELDQNRAQIRRLDADLRFRRQEAARLTELAQSSAVPASRLDEAIALRDMTEADLAEAHLAEARTRLLIERTAVHAPFTGQVAERFIALGEYASVGTPVARLVDVDDVEVRAMTPLAQARYLAEGSRVRIASEDQEIEAPVRAVVPVGDEVSRTIELRIAVPARSWMIGTAVRVALPAGEPEDVVVVPRDALILRADNVYVYKVSADDTAERVVVRTGAAREGYVAVTGPIAEGDRVVVRGGQFLRPGQPLAGPGVD